MAPVIAGAQVLVEGPRWQMIPAYALSAVLFLIGLLQLHKPGRDPRRRRASPFPEGIFETTR
jgi:hypothetical protein